MRITLHAAVATCLIMLTSAAQAQDKEKAREACKDDAQQFCSGVQPGGGRILNCLEDHYKDISDSCYAIVEKIAAKQKNRSNANNGGSSSGNDGGGQ